MRKGWSDYIERYNLREGPVTDEEHTAFLNMWLDRFFFCGASLGPSRTFSAIAARLANGQPIALSKLLLGSVYHMLHTISDRLKKLGKVGTLGGLLWFVQI